MSISVSSKNVWGIATALCIAAIAALGDILTYHENLYAFHGSVRKVDPNGDIIVDLGSKAGVSLGLTGVVVRKEPRELFVATVMVKNVIGGDVIIEKTSGTLPVISGDHVFLGKKSQVHQAPDTRFAGTFSGLWDSTNSGISYRYPRTIVINDDLKSGTDTIKQPTGEVKTFGITGEVEGTQFIGKNHPTPGDGWVQDQLTLTLDAGGHELSVVSFAQGKTERATLYRKGHEPPISGSIGKAAWPRVVRYRKLYTSPVRSLALEPVWSHDGSKILVRTSEGPKGDQHWISSTDGTLLGPPEAPIGWDPSFSKTSGLIVSCLRNVTAGETNHVVRLSDRDGKIVRDYKVGENPIRNPSIGPSGTVIAFQQAQSRDENGKAKDWRIVILDTVSGDVKTVPAQGLDKCTSPVWSLDGGSLLCYLDPIPGGGPSGIGTLQRETGTWNVQAKKVNRRDGWALTYGPTERCCLTIDFYSESLAEGGKDVVIDVLAVNLEAQRADFLQLAQNQYPRPPNGKAGLKNRYSAMPETVQLSTDGTRLLCELHKYEETGFFSELWVADLEWGEDIPDRARYVGLDSVPFQDNFDDNRANWDTDNVDGKGYKLIRNGCYEFKVETNSTFTWGKTAYDYRDFVCSVTAKRIEGPDENQFGIIFRMADSNNYYRFGISSDRFFRLDKWVAGREEEIKRWESSDAIFGGDKKDTIGVRCSGQSLSLYANGNLLAEVNDTSHSVGKIALFAGTIGDKKGVSVVFDDFTVTPIDDMRNVFVQSILPLQGREK